MENQFFAATSFDVISAADTVSPRWRRRRDPNTAVAASSLSHASLIFATLALAAATLLPAADALPGSRSYYSSYRSDDDRFAPIQQRLPSFADSMPSKLYYGGAAGSHHRLVSGFGDGVAIDGAMGRRMFGRHADMPPRKQQLSPLDDEIVSVERRDSSERLIGKKYDRNCFFSPVQCMLSFNKRPSDEVMWNSRK